MMHILYMFFQLYIIGIWFTYYKIIIKFLHKNNSYIHKNIKIDRI